jgi:hypothetical protein
MMRLYEHGLLRKSQAPKSLYDGACVSRRGMSGLDITEATAKVSALRKEGDAVTASALGTR